MTPTTNEHYTINKLQFKIRDKDLKLEKMEKAIDFILECARMKGDTDYVNLIKKSLGGIKTTHVFF